VVALLVFDFHKDTCFATAEFLPSVQEVHSRLCKYEFMNDA
jgi:hypothetical protein